MQFPCQYGTQKSGHRGIVYKLSQTFYNKLQNETKYYNSLHLLTGTGIAVDILLQSLPGMLFDLTCFDTCITNFNRYENCK
jgi:hypothetical protein